MNDFAKNTNDAWLDGMDEVKDLYGNESDERSDREDIPDGNYQVQVEKIELAKAKTSGNTMLKWQLRIIAPQQIGRVLFKNHVFTPNCLRYIKQDLGLCGFDHSKFRELPDHLTDFLDLQLEVAKRTSQPATEDRPASYNLYFNRLIGRGKPGDDAYEPSTDSRLNSF